MAENKMIEETLTESDYRPVATRTRRLSNNNHNRNQGISSNTLRCDLQHNRRRKDLIQEHLIYILMKDESSRTEDELKQLEQSNHLIPAAKAFIQRKMSRIALAERLKELEDEPEVIEGKIDSLVEMIRASNYTVIYTGAGVSTSASIPDYRGPNGLWTQIRRTGAFSLTKLHDLSKAEPTYTHMAISELVRRKVVNHVVSQNVDGLHLRSNIPQARLSEIHGNMYIEICQTCEKQYFREADVTKRTSRFRHKTGRKCHSCSGPEDNLIDTIVLYGERSRSTWPMNWERASRAAKRSDLIICMGSSLRTLRRYACLWPKSFYGKASKSKLVIINLQGTSKDKSAELVIHGKCDDVMQRMMQKLSLTVPNYEWSKDPLSRLSVPFTNEEKADLKGGLISELQNGEDIVVAERISGMKVEQTPTDEAAMNNINSEQVSCKLNPPASRPAGYFVPKLKDVNEKNDDDDDDDDDETDDGTDPDGDQDNKRQLMMCIPSQDLVESNGTTIVGCHVDLDMATRLI